MKTKTWKLFTTLFVSAVAALTILACAGGDDEYDYSSYSLFAPEIIQQPASEPFFLSYHLFYKLPYYETPQTHPTVNGRNMDEWRSFFKNTLNDPQVEWLVYKSGISTLQLLQTFKPKNSLPDTIDRTLAVVLAAHKQRKPILEYLILAKEAEALCDPRYYYWEQPEYDTIALAELVKDCKVRFSKTSNTFLKNRFGFQLTRALSMVGWHNECINFYDTQFKPTPDAGSMYYRSLGYKARSLYKKGNYTQANYIFSRLFAEDPPSRYTAFQSFHPQEEEDWNATLQLTKNTEEKELLWQLLGIYADPARALEEIYNLNPKSEYMQLLLVRSVNLAEAHSLFTQLDGWDGFNYSAYNPPADEEEEEYNTMNIGYADLAMGKTDQKILRKVIARILSEKKVNNPALWQLSYSYLNILSGDYTKAEQALNEAKPDVNDSLMVGQKAVIKGVLEIKKLKTINRSSEEKVYECVEEMRSKDADGLRTYNAIQYIISNLSVLYRQAGDTLKSELAFPRGAYYYSSLQATQNMIDFMTRPNLTNMEELLVKRYPLKKADLHDIKAMHYIYAYDFKNALKEYKSDANAGANGLYGNPFTIHITDCHDCDHQAPKKVSYTNLSFVEKMIELKAKGDSLKSDEERAQNYFLFANGLYNMTWYGNARTLRDTKVSGYYYEQPDESEFTECNEALIYYTKAASLTQNKEFKAKCTWMAAKCEHNIWLEGTESVEQEDYNSTSQNLDFIPGKYFALMKKDFADTRYYNEVIKECGYFCTYITHSKDCIRNKDSY